MLRGHDVEISAINVAGYQITKCPLLYSKHIDKVYFQLAMDYRKGILPNAGGQLDQPWKFYMMMNIVESVITDLEKEETK